MIGTFLSSESGLSSGGTIGGDLTIDGDLTVNGDNSGAYSEIITDGLQITKDSDAEFVSLILVNQSDAADTTGSVSMRFDLEDTAGNTVDSAKIIVSKDQSFTDASGTQDSSMAFHTSLNGTLAEKVRITSDGSVGIGTAIPGSYAGGYNKLVVGGGAANAGITIASNDASGGEANLAFSDAADGTVEGRIEYKFRSGADTMTFMTNASAKFKLDANSRISLSNNDNNSFNTVFGHSAFNAGSDNNSDSNTIIGYQAAGIGTVSAANDNVAVGYQALNDLTNADSNVAIGSVAGANLTESNNNTLVGFGTGRAITTGAEGTVAIGYNALTALTTGVGNLAIGYQALQHPDTGDYNIAIGHNVMSELNSAGATRDCDYNIGIGYNSMSGTWVTAESDNNVAVGSLTMAGAMNGALNNTAVGHQALTALTTGDDNLGVGFNAGDSITEGSSNTAIGSYADCAATTNSQIAIGTVAVTSAANAIAIGVNITNSTTETFMWGASSKTIITTDFDTSSVAFSQSSDVRKKRNIKDGDLGLEFINKLRNVSFQWKPQNEYPKEWESYSEVNTVDTETVRHGFIAQEVKQALDECGVDTSAKDGMWSEDDDGMQRLSNAKLVLPLVKAVQELSKKVEELEAKLSE